LHCAVGGIAVRRGTGSLRHMGGTERRNMPLRKRVLLAVPYLADVRYLLAAIMKLSRADRRECNLCGYSGRFWPMGDPPRRGAACAGCRSVERHRLLGLWAAADPAAIEGVRILHFAPEPILTKLFRSLTKDYQSADLNSEAADTVLNIEAIDLPDESVDIVVCSHVLEHVDDAKALHELWRILKPQGRVILMFPIVEGWERTYENPAHTTRADRIRYYGQHNHVRMFGRDVRERIRDAGFELTEFTAEEPAVARYGLTRGEKVFIGSKVVRA
jgi:SAM-dependent methyltransferase